MWLRSFYMIELSTIKVKHTHLRSSCACALVFVSLYRVAFTFRSQQCSARSCEVSEQYWKEKKKTIQRIHTQHRIYFWYSTRERISIKHFLYSNHTCAQSFGQVTKDNLKYLQWQCVQSERKRESVCENKKKKRRVVKLFIRWIFDVLQPFTSDYIQKRSLQSVKYMCWCVHLLKS